MSNQEKDQDQKQSQNQSQEEPLFQGMDEYERTYAPEELPPDDPERRRAEAEEEGRDIDVGDLESRSTAPEEHG